MSGSLDPALMSAENERIEQALQLLRGFLRRGRTALKRSHVPNAPIAPTASVEIERSGADRWESSR
jgi:hypothetical protein